MKKGIYALEINGRYYIGKDHFIEKERRIKNHLNLLNKGLHYNRYLQKAFSKYGVIKTHILAVYNEISREGLCIEERKFITKYDSYKNGYNLTLGGEGGHGLIITEERKREMSQRIIGEKNPNAKLKNEQFFELVDLFIRGKSNRFIGELYDLHDRYVSLIRHKHRFKAFWKLVEGYVPTKSNDVAELFGSISEEEFKIIVNKMLNGETNDEIEEEHSLSSGSASRIRNHQLYSIWWEKHFSPVEDIQKKIKENHQKRIKQKIIENGRRKAGVIKSESTRKTMSLKNGNRKGVIIDNVYYHSMTEAERQLGISRKIIAIRVMQEDFPNYKKAVETLEPQKNKPNTRKSKRIRIDDKEYISIMEASRQLGLNNRTISDRVRSPSFPNYEFIEEGENPLSPKARKVIIEGTIYRSINLASKELKINLNEIKRRLDSKDYASYNYFDEIKS